MYVKNTVTNIQAAIFADGVVASYYDGLEFSGESGHEGEPESLSEFFQYMLNKNNSYQLKWEGSIASKNTIGGASAPEEGSMYRSKANRPTDDKLVAQFYDLNYLRLFRLGLQLCEEVCTRPCDPDSVCCDPKPVCAVTGLPIDQQCNMGLNNNDIKSIAEYLGSVFNEDYDPPQVCNGINPFEPEETGGDLVMIAPDENLAEGLHNARFESGCCLKGDVPVVSTSVTCGASETEQQCMSGVCPVACEWGPAYVFYRPMESFLFKTD